MATTRTFHTRGQFPAQLATGNVVNHGFISVETADSILRQAMSAWGLSSGSSESSREQVMTAIVEASLQGTSAARDYTAVSFSIDGVPYFLDVLRSACAQHYSSDNPLRPWFRSYQKGTMAMRAHDMLNNPLNVPERQAAAAKYGVDMQDVRFCFDYADGLLTTGIDWSAADRNKIKQLTAFITSQAQSAALAKGQSRTDADTNNLVGNSHAAITGAGTSFVVPSTADVGSRAKFPTLNL